MSCMMGNASSCVPVYLHRLSAADVLILTMTRKNVKLKLGSSQKKKCLYTSHMKRVDILTALVIYNRESNCLHTRIDLISTLHLYACK